MAKTVPTNNLAHARAFIERFGFGDGHVTIDQFDTWIIDRGLATDPGTSDVKDNAYKGFVQQRGSARKLLNTAGAWINGQSFQIVVSNERGGNYSVKPWATDCREFARNITNQIKTYTNSRVGNLKSMRSKAEGLIAVYGEDDDLHDAISLLGEMTSQGVIMEAKIAGLLKQYDTAYDAVSARLEAAMRARIEDQSAE